MSAKPRFMRIVNKTTREWSDHSLDLNEFHIYPVDDSPADAIAYMAGEALRCADAEKSLAWQWLRHQALNGNVHAQIAMAEWARLAALANRRAEGK